MINELNKFKQQVHKGLVLGFSAFMLITVYGVLFIKIGRVVLPTSVNLGSKFKHDLWAFMVLCLINPFLE